MQGGRRWQQAGKSHCRVSHAGIIRAVTGVQTYAVVVGVNIDDGIDVETLGGVHTDLD